MKEEKPKLKHNMEPSDVNTRVQTCNYDNQTLPATMSVHRLQATIAV